MNIKTEDILATIKQLTQLIIDFHQERPKEKPSCDCGCDGKVYWHGSYNRYLYLREKGFPNVKVFRIICAKCWRTKSVLHPFILKHAQSSLPTIVAFFVYIDMVGTSIRQAVKVLWQSSSRFIGYYWKKKRNYLISYCAHQFDSGYRDSNDKFVHLLNFLKMEHAF